MKTRIITFILVLNIFTIFGQKLELEKASPFTAVKWEKDQPVVLFNNEWYHFEKLDSLSKKRILDFCKKKFGYKWKKRFSEDLIEVLKGLNYIPNKQVDLELFKDSVSKTYKGTFTFENRQHCLVYNRNHKESKSTIKFPQKISKEQAIKDLKQFESILDVRSSYAQLTSFDYVSAIKKLEIAISRKKDDLNIDEFVNKIGKIMSEIGDRHSSIKNKSFDKSNYETYGLRLPFGVTVVDEKIMAVKQNLNDKNYTYYNNKFPYIKSIDGVSIDTLIDIYNYRDKKAPKNVKFSSGAEAIQKYGELLFKNNKQLSRKVEVVFTNDIIDKVEQVELITDRNGYTSKLSKDTFKSMIKVRKTKQLNHLSKLLNDTIGYIKIPMMYHYEDIQGLESFIKSTIEGFSNTKALIIDIRNNPGGGREILQTFASYIVQPEQTPWIANVAYLRTNKNITSDEESMNGRYLYTYNSNKLSHTDREAIDLFNKNFKPQREFKNSKFSSPFYMVLHAGKTLYTKPVYILVNEKSFSAATVFTCAFKGLPNVKIVGVTTDGSSGNSRKIYLDNSNIRVKVSTMLSFQRNGKTLDGNGTEPDIYIPIDLEQTFTGKDTQLQKLVEIINKNK
ncbi:S41 family peptidase [Aquimarina sp. 2201CG5-10]|uniref:S41 family peptidase n=1 Tax=Aquimarina callyspongiae TaxID=3098150 RepID=UPI002AB38B59|nr:S41 family peptidase [Aquimarina sp. 2201CG5-10]MDY8135991.1 S41 family peptidase [Aquimarina sp. 2201CG5-10]